MIYLSVVLFFLFSGCAHKSNVADRSLKTSGYKSEFINFWAQAKNQSPETQVKYWNDLVESPHREFYNTFVWPEKKPADFEARRSQLLKNAFSKYEANYDTILSTFDFFSNTLDAQVNRFREKFPDSRFDGQFIAALAPTFNAKTGQLRSLPNQLILAFAIDLMVARKDNPEVLYSHELFHIYHAEKSGIHDDGAMSGVRITIPLWSEGLATYASYEMNPAAKLSDVFMDTQLADLDNTRGREIAAEFLDVAEHITFGADHPNTYQKWFTMGTSFKNGFPSRCGYWIGFKVVEKLRETYSLKEMASWDISQAHIEVKKVLRVLSGTK